jgi:hypothetical protein
MKNHTQEFGSFFISKSVIENMTDKQASSMSHSFSIEMASRVNLSRLSISSEPMEVLIEGDLGKCLEIEVVEGIMLQVTGEKGVFRIDLSESEAERIRLFLQKK